LLTPGSYSDTKALWAYSFDWPEQSWVVGDKAYNDYEAEDALQGAGVVLSPLRKRNSKRALPAWTRYLQSCYRKVVETTASLIERLLPKSIHAVTPKGLELKVGLFVLASSINFLPLEVATWVSIIQKERREGGGTHKYSVSFHVGKIRSVLAEQDHGCVVG
jgi:hypothetical protein